MPVRDTDYMQRDRRRIAAAAAEVLFEKGVTDTSIRDICKRSGMSMGGVYVHFASKRDIIVAAIESIVEGAAALPSLATWNDLVELLRLRHFTIQSDAARQYARLQLEFLGSIVTSGDESPQLRAIREKDEELLGDSLLKLQESGEIEMPLGLQATRSAIRWIALGSAQDYLASPSLDLFKAWTEKVSVMEMLVAPRWPVGAEMLEAPEQIADVPPPKKLRRKEDP